MPELTIVSKLVGGDKTEADLERLVRAYDDVGESSSDSFKKGEKSASVFGGTMQNVKSIVAGLATAFGGLGLVNQIQHWTGEAVRFEEEWAKVKTLLSGTPESAAKLKQDMKELGVDFGTGAERAKALFSVIKAGFKEADSVNVLEQAMRLAQTAFIGTDEAINLLKVSLNAFDKDASDAADTASKLFVVLSKGGGMGAGELAMALGRLAPMAKDLGVSMEDIGVTMGTLKERGMSSMQAFQALNLVFTKMTQEGSKMNKILKDRGADLDKETVKTKGFAYVMNELKDAIAGDVEVTEQLGIGQRQMGPILALTGSAYDTYKQKLDATTESMKLQNKAWEAVNDTVGDKWSDLMTAVTLKMDDLNENSKALKGFLDGLISTVETGVPPLNGLTLAMGTFIAVLAVDKVIAFGSALLKQIAVMKELLAVTKAVSFAEYLGNLRAMQTQVGFTVAKLGKLKSAGLVAAAAFVGWQIGRWIADMTGADKALAKFWTTLGLFQGRVKEATKTAEDGYQKAADALEKNWGPQLEAAGMSVQRNGQTIEQWGVTLGKAQQAMQKLVKVQKDGNEAKETAIKLTPVETQKLEELTKKMEAAVNPAKELNEQIALLQKGGKWDSGAFAQAYSKEILGIIALYQQMGKEVPKAIAGLEDEARSFEDVANAAAKAQGIEKKWIEGLEEEVGLYDQVTYALKKYNLEGMTPLLKIMHDKYAQEMLATGMARDMAEAQEMANRKVSEWTQTLTKGRQALKELDDSEIANGPVTAALAEEWRKLGLAVPIGNFGQVAAELDEVTAAMNKLGIKNVDEEIREAELALDKIVRQTGVSQEKLVQANLAVMQKYLAGNREMTQANVEMLAEWAFSTEKVIRDQALPVWMEYAEKTRKVNGEFRADVIDNLEKAMTGTDVMLKQKMIPLWQEYIETVRDEMGNLPPAVEAINQQLVDNAEDTSKNWSQVWMQEISTVLDDLSKGIVDALLSEEKGLDKFTNIFKEWGKSFMRMVVNNILGPLQQKFGDFMSGKGWAPSTAGAVPGLSVQGALGSLPGGSGGASADWVGPTLAQAQGTDWAGPTLAQAGKMGGGSGSFMGAEGQAGAMLQQAMMAGGTAAFMDSFSQKGVRGWAEGIGGGAAMGAAIGSAIPGLGTAVGAAIGASVGLLTRVIKSIMGKSTEEAGSMEVARDYGGVAVGEDAFAQFISEKGISSGDAYDVRKNITSSPEFLKNVAWEAAQAQGKTDEFLKSLEKVETSWGTFDFREAFEEGALTGDWEALNKVWEETAKLGEDLEAISPGLTEAMKVGGQQAFAAAQSFMEYYKALEENGEISEEFQKYIEENRTALEAYAKESSFFAKKLAEVDAALVNMKEHAGELSELANLKAGFQEITDTLNAFQPVATSVFDTFLDTGEITDSLAASIIKFGGDLQIFQDVADVTGLINGFKALVGHFKETGEILPELRQLTEEYGGSLAALDAAAELPALNQLVGDISTLKDELNELVPVQSALQKLMEGTFDEEGLRAMGLDPSKLEKIAGLIKGQKNWASALEEFRKTGHLDKGGVIAEALSQYGGAEGKYALERYAQGVNTISEKLLASTKENMDDSFSAERKAVFAYLDEVTAATSDKIATITSQVEDQFAIVSQNLASVFEGVRIKAIEQIDLIMAALTASTNAMLGLGTAAVDATATGASVAGGVEITPGGTVTEGGSAAKQAESSETPVTIHVNFGEGAVFYGMSDFQAQVEKAVTAAVASGGLKVLQA